MSFEDYRPAAYNEPYDSWTNPRKCGSLAVTRAPGTPLVGMLVLPVAPAGYLWSVVNGNVQGDAATSWSIREEVAGEPVRIMDQRAVASGGGTLQAGGLFTKGPLRLYNLGAANVRYHGTVRALRLQRFWLELTGAFQVVPMELAANLEMSPVPTGVNATGQAAMWFNNGDSVSRTLELRFTRGAYTVTNPSTATTANQRAVPLLGAGSFPPMEPGDVLEARCTTAPAVGTCFFGGALIPTPSMGIT